MGDPAETLPALMTAAEVGRVIGAQANGVAKMVRRGKGPPVYGRGARGKLLFRVVDVDAWIRGRGRRDAKEEAPGGDPAGPRAVPDTRRAAAPEDGPRVGDRSHRAGAKRRRRSETPRERARHLAGGTRKTSGKRGPGEAG